MGTTKCDKSTVTCDVSITQYEDGAFKCDVLVTWYSKLPISGYRTLKKGGGGTTKLPIEYKSSISFFVFYFIFHQSQLAMYLFNFPYKIAKI